MDVLIEPIRYSLTAFSLVTAVAMLSALRSTGGRLPLLVVPWLAAATGAGVVLSHVLHLAPPLPLLPAVTAATMAAGLSQQFNPKVVALFRGLEDRQWRLLTATRATFGALILAGCGAGLFPAEFALPAGLGDLAAAALALVAPGSLAVGGHRGVRLLVFGFGLADFVSVAVLMVKVMVPWLAATHSLGPSLLLPWVAVPMLATLNLFGLRLALVEGAKAPAKAIANA